MTHEPQLMNLFSREKIHSTKESLLMLRNINDVLFIFTSSIFHNFSLFSYIPQAFTISRHLSCFLSLSSFRFYRLLLALLLVLSPTPAFTSRLWILLSNTYIARTAIQTRECVRASACCTQANGKAWVLIQGDISHSRGYNRRFVPFSMQLNTY